MAERLTTYGEVVELLGLLPMLCREKRRREGLSLRAAADQIEGVSFSTLTRLEHRASECHVDHVTAILRWLDGADSTTHAEPPDTAHPTARQPEECP